MPDMTPVGAMIQPPNPAAGIDNYSRILGLQQQKLGLQQGAAVLQTEQAQAAQNQQRNQELQKLHQFASQAMEDPKYRNPDGSLNIQRFQADASQVAPTYGQEYIGQVTSNANQAVAGRKALLDLSNDQRSTIGSYLAAVAAKPNATLEDFQDAIEQARGVSNDPAYQRSIDNFLMHTPPTMGMTTEQQSQTLRQYARNAAVATGAPGAAQSAPQVGSITNPKGNRQYVQENPQSPMGVGPIGSPVEQGVPPQVVTPPGGIPTSFKGGGSAQGPGSSGGPAPTTQDWENFGGYQQNLNQRVRIASDSIPRIEAAEKALDSMRAGAGAEAYSKWAKRLQAIGAPESLVDAVGNGNLAAAQEAEKYLFQTTFSGLRQSMQGDPARVAEFQSAEQIFPSVGTDPRATKRVLQFMVDQGQRDFSEQQALIKARKDKTFNPATWEADYQAQLRAGKVPGVPHSQVPGEGAEPSRRMPTGNRLQAYADKYFGGDEAKATEFLKGHAYQ